MAYPISRDDPNYANFRTYIEERGTLLVSHENEYVAYAGGRQVAIGKSMKTVKRIAFEGTDRPIMIQQILPAEKEKVVKLRSPRRTKIF